MDVRQIVALAIVLALVVVLTAAAIHMIRKRRPRHVRIELCKPK